MRTIAALFVALAIVPILYGCSGKGQDVFIPRDLAFPRLSLYDSTYRPINGLPLNFEANACARCSVLRTERDNVWFDINYRKYKAILHCTASKVDSISKEKAIANRIERMRLNSGLNTTNILTARSPKGVSSRICVTPAGNITPVQFVIDDSVWVISGALYVGVIPEHADSIVPMLDAVVRDINHAIKCL